MALSSCFVEFFLFLQGPELEPSQQQAEEMPEDTLERLAHMERLVVQLKDLVREKDAHLQQKDALLQVLLVCVNAAAVLA